jgi:hypothetical protein
MPDDDLNLGDLERAVVDELDSYRYEVPEGLLGRPASDEWVERQLAELRSALVKPEWRVVLMNDSGESEARRCVLVADDGKGHGLYYDPTEQDFVLAAGDPPETLGVRGDPVGCFMAR